MHVVCHQETHWDVLVVEGVPPTQPAVARSLCVEFQTHFGILFTQMSALS